VGLAHETTECARVLKGVRLDLELTGRTALVTAASEGLGLACAMQLAKAGCRVAICARDPSKLGAARCEIEQARPGLAPVAIETDLADRDRTEALFDVAVDRLGGIDLLVINSGHMPYGCFEELTDADWYCSFELLLMSALRLSRRAAAHMRGRGRGDIVLITAAGAKHPSPQLVLSNVMRAGLATLAKSMADELAPADIRVNVVAPGYFDTGRVSSRVDALVVTERLDRNEAARRVAGAIPLARLGTAEELADLVVFVLSRRAGFMTGATIVMDGGAGRSAF